MKFAASAVLAALASRLRMTARPAGDLLRHLCDPDSDAYLAHLQPPVPDPLPSRQAQEGDNATAMGCNEVRHLS
jgi:hypothetical protein